MQGTRLKLLIVFLSWILYIIIGAFIFQAIEGSNDNATGNSGVKLLEEIKKNVTATFNMTESEFDNFVLQIQSAASSSEKGNEWTFTHAMAFIVQLLTTIGYGNITPVTTAGRIICIFYALIGIPLNIMLLQLVGQVVLRGQQILVSKVEKDLLKREGEPKFVNEKCTLLGLLLLLTLLLVCTGIQVSLDNWTFLDGIYCYFITFATVGFGDLIPGNSQEQGPIKPGLVFLRILLIVLGLVAMSNVLNAVLSCEDSAKWLTRLRGRCSGETTDSVEEEEKGNNIEMTDPTPS